jgi:hypothetical protein
MLSPSQVYWTGMSALSAKAGLVRVKAISIDATSLAAKAG